MATDTIKLSYESTIGAMVGTKPNPLWHITITCHGANRVADINLGFDVEVASSKETQAVLRNAVRKYLGGALREGEGIRCWLGVYGNPRANLWLRRKSGQIGVEFENADIMDRIQYWCTRAGVALH